MIQKKNDITPTISPLAIFGILLCFKFQKVLSFSSFIHKSSLSTFYQVLRKSFGTYDLENTKLNYCLDLEHVCDRGQRNNKGNWFSQSTDMLLYQYKDMTQILQDIIWFLIKPVKWRLESSLEIFSKDFLDLIFHQILTNSFQYLKLLKKEHNKAEK